MNATLVDTSVLTRLANATDKSNPIASRAVILLQRSGVILHVAPQNLIEFRTVATRPISVNGLGLSGQEAEMHIAAFEASFALLPETPDLFPAWKSIVSSANVLGKKVHDARLVAICHLHKIPQALTFNIADFIRLSRLPPGLVVLDPSTI